MDLVSIPASRIVEISRLAFTMQFRGRHLRVEITPTNATYTLPTGEPLQIRHYGELLIL